jgi:autophagy-related protein 17
VDREFSDSCFGQDHRHCVRGFLRNAEILGMDSSTASLPRPVVSPAASFQAPTIDGLISNLLASKRSLASIHHVHRATTILSTAHAALESMTILSARTSYLQRSLTSQLKILRGVQFELEDIANNTQSEFNLVLKDLDASHKRLEDTVKALRDTKIDDGFKIGRPPASDGEADRELKENLHDFVDDKPVEELKDGLKASIDEVQEAKRAMDESIQSFEDDLQNVNNALGERTVSSSSTRSDLQQPDIPALLKNLDGHAKEMAKSLESLVKHFDLCVTAIKHTEGGGAAVAENVSANDLPEGVGVEDFQTPAQPITEEERLEMMQVLENDANEVDEVVMEIQDHSAEMEAQLDQILMWKDRKEGRYEDFLGAFKLLEQVNARLPSYVSQSAVYSTRWSEERLKIEEGITGLEDLRTVYENFLGAYDGLIVEVARRKAVKIQMEKVVREAQAKLDKLYEDDATDRDAFRIDQGDYLPSDIWPGLANPPPRYIISRADDESGSVPDLPRKTVEEALKRLKAGNLRMSVR